MAGVFRGEPKGLHPFNGVALSEMARKTILVLSDFPFHRMARLDDVLKSGPSATETPKWAARLLYESVRFLLFKGCQNGNPSFCQVPQ